MTKKQATKYEDFKDGLEYIDEVNDLFSFENIAEHVCSLIQMIAHILIMCYLIQNGQKFVVTNSMTE